MDPDDLILTFSTTSTTLDSTLAHDDLAARICYFALGHLYATDAQAYALARERILHVHRMGDGLYVAFELPLTRMIRDAMTTAWRKATPYRDVHFYHVRKHHWAAIMAEAK